MRDFREHGQKTIAKVRRTQPAAYLKICALLVPKEMKLEHSTNAIKQLTDEQFEAMIEYLETAMEEQARGSAKVIEATAEPTALPAPTELKQTQRNPTNRTA